jgi:putative tryptophan/tyrosine transport system substrate-binding protein
MSNRREFITLLGGAVAWPLKARAQQADKVPRIGLLLFASADDAAYAKLIEAFRRGLRDLGYVEGRNVMIEYRFAGNTHERLAQLAAELVRTQVDVIVSHGTPGTLAAMRATATIPIVMTTAGDPAGSGLVASLSQPGGNVTGLSLMMPDLGGKRLELLKEFVPELRRAAVLWNALNPLSALLVQQAQDAAVKLGIELQPITVAGADDLDRALAVAAADRRASGLIVAEDGLTLAKRIQIVAFAAGLGIPAIYGLKEFTDVGGLLSYGAHFADLWRRAATYVDKIIKGARPADLPVEQPTRFEMVINLRTAKALGLEVPPILLARADEVIE